MFVSIEMFLRPGLCMSVPLVVVMDEGNRQAENGVDVAIKYLAQNNMASINKKTVVDFMTEEEPGKAVGKGETRCNV